MKRLCLLAIACAIALPAHAAIVITEVMAGSLNPDGNANPATGNGNGDWFEIYNDGAAPVDLTGWSWDDDSNLAGTSLFPSIILNPGKFVIVLDEDVDNTLEWISNVWGVQSLVDNGTLTIASALNTFPGLSAPNGDTIYLYNASSTLITSRTFGASTPGHSLAWTKTGIPLGTSTAGVNEAFVAPGDGSEPSQPGVDVASPGFAAVPEPGTVALAAIGLTFGIFMLRRRRLAR
jgi:hypothetical protein